MKFLYVVIFLSSCFLQAQNIPLYVGTYTGSDSEGIYYYDFNTKTGKLTHKKLAVKTKNPSFLAYATNRKFIYAVGEVANFNTTNSGFVSAFSVTENGQLQFINTVSSNGANPCHIELNAENAAISNYTGGTISIHKVEKNGAIKPAHQIINHNTPNNKSHAHSTQFINNQLFVADLGRNFLANYIRNNDTYFLKENYSMPLKSGPRHFEISKNGTYIYVINEYSSTVTVLKKEGEKYIKIQNINTLDESFEGESFGADIHLSNNESYLYGSNRGENSMVVFKRDTTTGTLQKIQNINVKGHWPRNFTLSPNGQFLLVANQKSKNISVFKIAINTGKLTYLYSEQAPTPVCLLF
ncbi:MAG: lactonase family protein [Lutibacter sp.]|uniref:lactonase family protein n=1 Tax=Lutibacter sp. TaxID=1925666 RepID=UPI00385B5D44